MAKPHIPRTLAGIISLGERLCKQNVLAEKAAKKASIPANKAKWNAEMSWGKNYDDILNKRFRLHWAWMRATEPEKLIKLLSKPSHTTEAR